MNDKNEPWVIRTDFSNEPAWEHVCRLIAAPQTEHKFYAYVQYVNDERWRDATPDALFTAVASSPAGYGFAVDQFCMSNPEHPVLVLGTGLSWEEPNENADDEDPVTTNLIFRALPSTVQSIQNNVSIGNMGLEEFADSVDADGVFRGFPQG